ncbi:unnamed protein product [Brachionus calyciflorus]|uniref:Uncharacterized protein n=1 Tax=Brachionus calyciflorus TaxID=104777 RepID=A0A813Y941_9BILA|nr:unnamed protein product [Brachionus calyciflorus]
MDIYKRRFKYLYLKKSLPISTFYKSKKKNERLIKLSNFETKKIHGNIKLQPFAPKDSTYTTRPCAQLVENEEFNNDNSWVDLPYSSTKVDENEVVIESDENEMVTVINQKENYSEIYDLNRNTNESSQMQIDYKLSIRDQLIRIFQKNPHLIRYKYSGINDDKIKDIYDGQIYQDIVQNEISKFYTFTLNTDGVQLCNKSKMSIWPIILVSNELPIGERFRFDNIIIAGLSVSNGKPALGFLFNQIKNELKALEEGVYLFQDIYIKVHFYLMASVFDKPARCSFLGMVSSTGYHSCYKCLQKGKRVAQGIFYEIMDIEYYNNLIYLVIVLEFFYSENLLKSDLGKVQNIIREFLKDLEKLYVPSIIKSGFHELCHYVDIVSKFGPNQLKTIDFVIYNGILFTNKYKISRLYDYAIFDKKKNYMD